MDYAQKVLGHCCTPYLNSYSFDQSSCQMGWAHGSTLLSRGCFQPLGRQCSMTSSCTKKIKMWLLPGKPLDKLQNTIKLQVAFYPIAMNTRFVFYLVKKITSHMYCHVQYICEVKHFYTFDYCNPGLQGPPRPCAQPERLHNQKRPR